MVKKRVLVLTDTMPWGHRSIARAIYSFLKNKEREGENIKVEYAEVRAEYFKLDQIYNLIYRVSPKTNRIFHRVFHNKVMQNLVCQGSRVNLPRLKASVNWHKPDVIICAYFLHAHTLQEWRKKEEQRWKLWTVVADPWTITPGTLVKGSDKHLVYDERTVRVIKKLGFGNAEITGWWVRPEMYKTYNREKVRRALGFKDNRPVIFVGGGSLGTSAVTKLLPALFMVEKPIGLIINTGTDKLAFNMVAEYVKLFKRYRDKSLVQIKNLGWIDNMAEVLSACDIVFGKAGPNFLFDTVAAKKPFVAITHIGGQEDGNLEIIRKKKLGWVREKRSDLVEFFLRYVNNPEKYNHKFDQDIEREAERNKSGLERIWEMLKKNIPPKALLQ